MSPIHYGPQDDLHTLLQESLGKPEAARVTSSRNSTAHVLAQLLGVPEDLDALVQAALTGTDAPLSGDDRECPVETVTFTITTDESDPADPRINVQTEVISDEAFTGRPTVQVRYAKGDDHETLATLGNARSRPKLAYRPEWTPTLVHTPEELAEQMRIHWSDAIRALDGPADSRLTTFLSTAPRMDVARVVYSSNQTATAKFITLQGLLDPAGSIQFQGLELTASTFAEQIRGANEGDQDALNWLADICRERVMTSFSEVTGTDVTAAADFKLARWRDQGEEVIEAVTSDAAGDPWFAPIRHNLTMRLEIDANIEVLRANLAKTVPADQLEDEVAKFVYLPRDDSDAYGILEDWFFEETREYLRARFHQSIPSQFAAALSWQKTDSASTGLALETRRLASKTSIDARDYLPIKLRSRAAGPTYPYRTVFSSRDHGQGVRRGERIVQAVRSAISALEAAKDEDLGTLIAVHEVLAYAQWKRDELRGEELVAEITEQQNAAAQRAQEATKFAAAAERLGEKSRERLRHAAAAEKTVRSYADLLKRNASSIRLHELLPSAESKDTARIQGALDWVAATDGWLIAARDREEWARRMIEVAPTSRSRELLGAELDAAIAEQSEMSTTRQTALDEHRQAENDAAIIAEARAKYAKLMRPIREENEKRRQGEDEIRRVEAERAAQDRRRRDAEQREKQAAEVARQEAARRRQTEANSLQAERARKARTDIAPQLEQLLSLPQTASFWRRKALEGKRASLEQSILRLQDGITAPLSPPRTGSTTWPLMLSTGERYLGVVKKITDYGCFVSLPAGTDGLIRNLGHDFAPSPGTLVVVEISAMPYGKPILLKMVTP